MEQHVGLPPNLLHFLCLCRSAGLDAVNRHIASSVLGALWPLDASEGLSGCSRLRDIVSESSVIWWCQLCDNCACPSGMPLKPP
jgi:hypothetical protein